MFRPRKTVEHVLLCESLRILVSYKYEGYLLFLFLFAIFWLLWQPFLDLIILLITELSTRPWHITLRHIRATGMAFGGKILPANKTNFAPQKRTLLWLEV